MMLILLYIYILVWGGQQLASGYPVFGNPDKNAARSGVSGSSYQAKWWVMMLCCAVGFGSE